MNEAYLHSGDEEGYEQPLLVVTVARPWHWGIAMISGALDWDAPLLDDSVTLGAYGLSIQVAHPGDYDYEEGLHWEVASVTVVLLHKSRPLEDGRTSLLDGALVLRQPGFAVGDADGDVVIPAAAGTYQVRVSVPDGSDLERITDVNVEFLRTSQAV